MDLVLASTPTPTLGDGIAGFGVMASPVELVLVMARGNLARLGAASWLVAWDAFIVAIEHLPFGLGQDSLTGRGWTTTGCTC